MCHAPEIEIARIFLGDGEFMEVIQSDVISEVTVIGAIAFFAV